MKGTMRATLITALAVAIFFVGKYLWFKPKFVVGGHPPEIEFVMSDGHEFKLSDLEGKLTLVDFWGSWCGPCRKENPGLVKLYNEFHEASFKNAEGFEIVSIGLESNESRWLRAIQKDRLNWRWHYTDLKQMDSPIAKTWGVREIPTKYLLNEKGLILAVNPTIEELQSILSDRKL